MHEWLCKKCGHLVVAKEKPEPMRWDDGHVCYFADGDEAIDSIQEHIRALENEVRELERLDQQVIGNDDILQMEIKAYREEIKSLQATLNSFLKGGQ